MRSKVMGMEQAGEQQEWTVTLRGHNVLADLRDACERYGWQLPLAPFVPNDTDRATLRVIATHARKRKRVPFLPAASVR